MVMVWLLKSGRTFFRESGISLVSARRFSDSLLLLLWLITFLAPAYAASAKPTNSRTFLYSGLEGTLEYNWEAPIADAQNSLGTITVISHLQGTRSNRFSLNPNLKPLTGTLTVISCSWDRNITNPTLRLTYADLGHVITVFVSLQLSGKALVINVSADRPSLKVLDVGLWPSLAGTLRIPVPYYGYVLYLKSARLFANVYFDLQVSQATQIQGPAAVYYAQTNGMYNVLKERFTLCLSSKINDVYPTIPNRASRYLASVAGRMVVDIRSPVQFSTIAQRLNSLADYGVHDCIALIHVWQAKGYDNALPMHYPADQELGGDSDLRRAVAAGTSNNCYVGLHENYADYYPNYPQFTRDAIALNSTGQLALSYFNGATHIQSFATKAAWLSKNALTQSPQIHSRYGTNASFIDVNSAMIPWWRADMDARSPGAAEFKTFRDATVNLWRFERQTHGGPVFGEGGNHWAWSGLLDGVEAQLGAGGTQQTGDPAPLFVDFDIFKIHPLQVNQGMGYYERWLRPSQSIWNTDVADAYRMEEVAYGHSPYISDELWDSTARILQEYNLVAPVASRYGTQTAKSIAYQVNGAWADSTVAALNQDFSRVLVTYENGDTILANSKAQSMFENGLELPQYGWSAIGKDLLAYTAIKNGVIVDYAQVGDSFFANARNQMDLNASGAFARCTVMRFTQTGEGRAQFHLNWTGLDTTGSPNYLVFIHFVDNRNNVAFQADHSFALPTSQWAPGQVVNDTFQFSMPPGMRDGSYSVRIGLYSSVERSLLLGTSDGGRRYILGILTVQNSERRLTFSVQPMSFPAPQNRLNSAGAVVDFGNIQTDGMVSLVHDGDQWVLRVYPQYRQVVVRLNKSSFPEPTAVSCDARGTITRQPLQVGQYWQISALGAKQCTWPAR